MARWTGTIGIRRAAALLLALGGLTGCLHSHLDYVDDDVPLVAPLEGVAATPGEGYEDPPSRVARVSSLSGPVSIQQGGVDDWTAAVDNLPLKDGDALWSGPGGRAEVQVGPTGLRTSDATSLSVLRIADRFFQVGLDQGSLFVHILPGAFPDSAEIDTPAGAVNLAEAGTYRIDVDPSLPVGSVIVRSGEARITLNGEVVPVGPGERILLNAGTDPSYQVEKAPGPDAFEAWGEGRDKAAAQSRSALKLGKGVMGAADLDGAGTWQVHPRYGEIWVPRVAKDWAPYRQGRWTWVEPWGWTWVDDAPWGFAPSHYGRWANLDGTWAWVPKDPGGAAARPVYAPALVAFLGQAPGLKPQGRIPGGGVAWFPLAPGEAFVPAYPASGTYLKNLNAWVAPGTGTAKTYANLPVPGAVTAVPRSAFTSFAPVGPAAVPMNAKLFRKAPVGGAPALAPTTHSFQAASAASHPPAGTRSRPLVARSPMPALPVPFAARLASLQAAHGRPQPAAAIRAARAPGSVQARPWVNAVAHPSALRNRAAPSPAASAGVQREAAPAAAPRQAPYRPRAQAARAAGAAKGRARQGNGGRGGGRGRSKGSGGSRKR